MVLGDGAFRVLGGLVGDRGGAQELPELVPVELALLEGSDLLEQGLEILVRDFALIEVAHLEASGLHLGLLGLQLLLLDLLGLLLDGLSELRALADGDGVVREPSPSPAVLDLLLHDGSSATRDPALEASSVGPEELVAPLKGLLVASADGVTEPLDAASLH